MKKITLGLLVLAVLFSFGCARGAYYKGTKLAESGDYSASIYYFKEAIQNDPNDSKAHNNLGWTYQNLGRNDEAIAEYKEAIRLKILKGRTTSPISKHLKVYSPRLLKPQL